MGIHESGFEIQQGVLQAEECSSLLAALSTESSRVHRAGLRHLMVRKDVSTLAQDRRLREIAARVVGPSATPYRATLFDKSGATNWLVPWHQDTALPLTAPFDLAGWGPWSQKEGIPYAHAPAWALARVVALRVHLDESTSENGPLRVVPGSHEAGVLSDQSVRAYVRTNGHLECLVNRGGVLAMRPLLIHSSSKARVISPRRVLHIEYADALELGPGIQLALA